MKVSRQRQAIAAGILILLGALGTTVIPDKAPAANTQTGQDRPSAPSPPAAGQYMQIVAHEDDDILFMNPDIQQVVAANRPISTVYLTAGENTNSPTSPALAECNPTRNTPPRDIPVDSREHYAYCRQQGARDAWAAIAGVDSAWDSRAVQIEAPDGTSTAVQVDTLRGTQAPVNLVFLNLPDSADINLDTKPANDPVPPGKALPSMRAKNAVRRTIVPTGAAVVQRLDYDQHRLVGVLAGLLNWWQPTVLRIQDAHNPKNHSDHIAGAQFTAEAIAMAHRPNLQVVFERDYDTQFLPANLDPAQADRKQLQIFAAYARRDERLGTDDNPSAWSHREYRRMWAGTRWVARSPDGRLQAFAILGGRLTNWWQDFAGGWHGPTDLGAPGPLGPGVTVAQNRDGRLSVFALRTDSFETVTMSQVSVNGDWSLQWTSLGSPSAKSGNADQVGQPAVAVNQDGRLQVFVKNGGTGVSTKAQVAPNDRFADEWTDLGGDGVQDEVAATSTVEGRIELFAFSVSQTNPPSGRILHWSQAISNGPFGTARPMAGDEPAGPVTVATSNDGRLELFYRLGGGHNRRNEAIGAIGLTRQVQSGGGWSPHTENLGGHGGTGPIAAIDARATGGTASAGSPRDSRVVIMERNRDGGLSSTRQIGPDQQYDRSWLNTGGFVTNEPALAANADGRVFALAVDGEGRLMVNQQTASGAGPCFAGWQYASQLLG